MKITIALLTGSNNTERNVLRSFYQGILNYYSASTGFPLKGKKSVDFALEKYYNTKIDFSYEFKFDPCDIGVQFGSIKARENDHHQARQQLSQSSNNLIQIETPVLGRQIVDKSNHDYYRIGVNGFLNQSGQFFPRHSTLDSARLKSFKELLGIDCIRFRDHTLGEILILTQLPGDASLRGQNHAEWVIDTVETIRNITDQPIAIRLHPSLSDKGRREFLADLSPLIMKNYNKIRWSDPRYQTLQQDFESAGLAVTYSSGSAVDAVLAGIPCVAVDQGNMAYDISENFVENIRNPYVATAEEIDQWLLNLVYSQWSLEEIRNGTAWAHLVDVFLEMGIDLVLTPLEN